jgi:hypothetical protein
MPPIEFSCRNLSTVVSLSAIHDHDAASRDSAKGDHSDRTKGNGTSQKSAFAKYQAPCSLTNRNVVLLEPSSFRVEYLTVTGTLA